MRSLDDRLADSIPDHPAGYTQYAVRQLLTPEEFADFKTWMKGRPIFIEGSMAIYSWDQLVLWSGTKTNP